MKVMVIGSGAREHALAWKLSRRRQPTEIIVCPGNAGIAREFRCVAPSEEGVGGYLAVALREKVDYTVVGPEAPLVDGVVDLFLDNQQPIFGPRQDCAGVTEGSKRACKSLLVAAGVPTARFYETDSFAEAVSYLRQFPHPPVVKADGLAAGKGVFVSDTFEEAVQALYRLMIDKQFGQAGSSVVIEERLFGRECSFMVVTDGVFAIPLVQAQDYKRQLEGDLGPMTGGMGAYAPALQLGNSYLTEQIMCEIVFPTLRAISELYGPYTGLMYFGLMLTSEGPKVLEINCRFGDPEAQVILPLLQSDLLELMMRSGNVGGLKGLLEQVSWWPRQAVGVVVAAPGYPDKPQVGGQIHGYQDAEVGGSLFFYAGVQEGQDGGLVTSGGRVMTVVGIGKSREDARAFAYDSISRVKIEGGCQFRPDIAAEK
jgi:phosphoribosylamine--glycine ligase